MPIKESRYSPPLMLRNTSSSFQRTIYHEKNTAHHIIASSSPGRVSPLLKSLLEKNPKYTI
ncbi:predicted protein [Sclerotinia sclerotiorum 1980 UF-70]|uniref:Uncharacterized protein n=1 Tax=Sclerotinia sclerotiorum (strain ATCC 18683 / 1980 / Ss-1) TaxID=665079 RepID=A7EGM8_SCLS1|nr:predicted protein [Sclerotinia sclerotiorum 1980 UF-70]EDO01994.1 predicted protein [Sclerotinia sclerotiorum 1980 UF-70]